MSASQPLCLTARVERGLGATVLDWVRRVNGGLREIGWIRVGSDGDLDVGFFEELAAYALVDDEGAARRAISQMTEFLDAHATSIKADSLRLQAWEVCERMDRPLTRRGTRWKRDTEWDQTAHPNVSFLLTWRLQR